LQHLDFPPATETFVQLLQHRARQQPHAQLYSFLRDDGTKAELSYAELFSRAQTIAFHLQFNFQHNSQKNSEDNSAIQTGARVLLLLPPGLDLIAAFFGCLLAGMVAVPLPPPHPARLQVQKERVLSVAQDAQPAIVLCDAATKIALEPIAAEINLAAKANLPWLACDEFFGENVSGNRLDFENSQWREPKISGQTTAFLQYTSGSTARPKGVLISHENLLHNCALIYRAFGHSAQSRGVIWLPPYHDMGLIGGVLQPLYGGFPVSLFPPASFLMKPLRWLQTISDQKASTSGAPNFAYELCARKITQAQKETLDLSSWQVAFVGAEPVRSETLNRFSRAFESCGFKSEAFLPCYGLAESTLLVSGEKKNARPQVVHKNNSEFVSCGLAAFDLAVKIVDADRSTPVSDGEVGEIFVAGKSVAKGYWNREDETREVFGAQVAQLENQEFLRTGDLGFFQDGELFVCGREKDLILIAGRNHFPEDIERTIEASDEAIRACAAFGADVRVANVQGEDNTVEEKLIIAAEVDRLSQLDETWKNALMARLKIEVASRHDLRIHEILLHRVGGLPRTTSGKIQRARCRQEYFAPHNNNF